MVAPAVSQACPPSVPSVTLADVDLRCAIHGCSRPATFAFPSSGGPTPRCLRHALVYRPTFRRAVRVAAVVGTVLLIINQGDVLLAGHVTALVLAKSGLTYVVPFSVSTYSALGANRL